MGIPLAVSLRVFSWSIAITLGTVFVLILAIGGQISRLDDPPDSPKGVFDEVLELPEVQRYARVLRERSGGSVNLVAYLEGDPEPGSWDVFVGESHPTHVVRWATFRVHPPSGSIQVSESGGGFLSREEWLLKSR